MLMIEFHPHNYFKDYFEKLSCHYMALVLVLVLVLGDVKGLNYVYAILTT